MLAHNLGSYVWGTLASCACSFPYLAAQPVLCSNNQFISLSSQLLYDKKITEDVLVTWHSDYGNFSLFRVLTFLESWISNVFGLEVAL